MNLQEYSHTVRNCNFCPLRLGCKLPLELRGDSNPELVVVLDKPNAEEDYLLTPFSDRSSRFLINKLGQINWTYLLTYAVKCYNKCNVSQLNKMGKVCSDRFLKYELSQINPKAILAMGQYSHRYLIKERWNSKSFNKDIGNMYIAENNAVYTSCNSPHYYFTRGKSEMSWLDSFLQKLYNVMETISVKTSTVD